MRPLLVGGRHPSVEISLQFLQRTIDLLPEGPPIEFIQHRLVESFPDPVGLRMPRRGPGVINVLHRRVQLGSFADSAKTVR